MSNDGIPEMNNLFVLPEFIGKGVGLRLWQHAISYARGRNWKHFEMDADPFAAAKFYFKVGCVKVGETESTVLKGRLLPRLRYILI
jgi:GNAT superfamily N-acetyltransferase